MGLWREPLIQSWYQHGFAVGPVRAYPCYRWVCRGGPLYRENPTPYIKKHRFYSWTLSVKSLIVNAHWENSMGLKITRVCSRCSGVGWLKNKNEVKVNCGECRYECQICERKFDSFSACAAHQEAAHDENFWGTPKPRTLYQKNADSVNKMEMVFSRSIQTLPL